MVYPHVPRGIYEHQIVQYIPIPIETLFFGPRRLGGDWPYMKVVGGLQEYLSWRKNLDLPVSSSHPPDFEESLVVLAANLQVDDCMYRAEKAILVGSVRPGYVYVFKLTRKYFYRETFDLVLHDYAGRILLVTAGARGRSLARAASARLIPLQDHPLFQV